MIFFSTTKSDIFTTSSTFEHSFSCFCWLFLHKNFLKKNSCDFKAGKQFFIIKFPPLRPWLFSNLINQSLVTRNDNTFPIILNNLHLQKVYKPNIYLHTSCVRWWGPWDELAQSSLRGIVACWVLEIVLHIVPPPYTFYYMPLGPNSNAICSYTRRSMQAGSLQADR